MKNLKKKSLNRFGRKLTKRKLTKRKLTRMSKKKIIFKNNKLYQFYKLITKLRTKLNKQIILNNNSLFFEDDLKKIDIDNYAKNCVINEGFDFIEKIYLENLLKGKLIDSYLNYNNKIEYINNTDNKTISIGTWEIHDKKIINKPSIINNYKVSQYFDDKNFSVCYRFGIPLHNFKNNNLVEEIKSSIFKNNDSRKKIICVCLYTPCNTIFCDMLEKTGIEKYLHEDEIIKNYKKNLSEEFIPIFIPLNKQPLMSKLINIKKLNDHLQESIFSENINFSSLNLNKEEELFKSIVDFLIYYKKNLYKDYILCYHCKSGKDRTSIFDCIVQSTFYYLTLNKPIDYEEIRKLCKYFLLYSLVISYFSIGLIGLKLQNSLLGRYICGEHYDMFIGSEKMNKCSKS